MAQPIIAEKGDSTDTFGLLGQAFNLDERVVTAILTDGIDSLQDFRFFFATETDVETFIAKQEPVIPFAQLQISRLRGAWRAVRGQADEREGDRSLIEVSGLDDMLTTDELHDCKTRFWQRHKILFPSEGMPADSLISRCSKELSKRRLNIVAISSVENMFHQVMNSRKRKRKTLGDKPLH